MASSRPTHQRVTPAVGTPLAEQSNFWETKSVRWKKKSNMADRKQNSSSIKKSSAKKAKPAEAKVSESKRKENALASMLIMERQYPGITEQYLRFEEAKLPSCSHCGSRDTASVQVGIIGRTIYLAGASKKFKLVPNISDQKGKYFCNACNKFFD
jgi:RNA polymerase-binding transcription factor DksA